MADAHFLFFAVRSSAEAYLHTSPPQGHSTIGIPKCCEGFVVIWLRARKEFADNRFQLLFIYIYRYLWGVLMQVKMVDVLTTTHKWITCNLRELYRCVAWERRNVYSISTYLRQRIVDLWMQGHNAYLSINRIIRAKDQLPNQYVIVVKKANVKECSDWKSV